jgi:hypothetical protein
LPKTKKQKIKNKNLKEGQMSVKTLLTNLSKDLFEEESNTEESYELPEEIWFKLYEFVITDYEIQKVIRSKRGYITGPAYEDLNREALVSAIETYLKCQEIFKCHACNATSCNIFKINLITNLQKKLYKLQNLKKRNGQISYTECEHDEYDYPTHCRKDWNKTMNSEDTPLTEMIEEEEEEDREEIRKQNAKKILFAISKMNEKERQVWELYLQGIDIKEIAVRLKYKNMQGVYMVLRRSLWKVRM